MNDRKNWLENARVLSTIAVIVLHVASSISYKYGQVSTQIWLTGNFYDSLVRFCVPVFFMLSGALLLSKDYSLSDFLHKRIVRILPPFIFWSFIYIVYELFFATNNVYSISEIGNYTLTFLLHGSKYHLWFVYTLLGLYLFVPILRKWIKHSTPKEIRYFLIIWLATLLYQIPVLKPYLPNIVILNFSGYLGYMVLGYYLANNEIKGKYLPELLISIGFVITFWGTYFLTQKNNQFSGFFYEYLSLNIVVYSIGFFLLFKKITITNSIIIRCIHFIHEYSYGIYLVHVLLLGIFETLGFSEVTFHPILSIPLVSIACLIVSCGIIYLLKLNRYTARVAG